MKVLTKEWLKDMEYQELIGMLNGKTNKKIPLVFTNGGAEGIGDKNLHTVKTNLNVTDKENQISFVMVPDTFEYYGDYSDMPENIKSVEEDFQTQYINRLCIISYLPQDVLKSVKDKRMLALGYAEEDVKNAILKFCKGKRERAYKIFEKSCKETLNTAKELTIHGQILKHDYIPSIIYLFDDALITDVETAGGDMRLIVDNETLILKAASVLQEDCPANSFVRAIELYKNENNYELHLLLRKKDNNLIDNYYYATYRFKDMKLED